MNWATVIVAAIVAAVFIAIVTQGVRNKKKGKAMISCGCHCQGCPSAGLCHPQTDAEEKNAA